MRCVPTAGGTQFKRAACVQPAPGRQCVAEGLAARRVERAEAAARQAIGAFPGSAGIHADARCDLRALATVVINEPGAWEQLDSLARDWESQGRPRLRLPP